MKKFLLISIYLLVIACQKKPQPKLINQSVNQLVSANTHTFEVSYTPGANDSELYIKLDYPNGADSAYIFTTMGTKIKSYIITSDSVQVFGRSHDATIEYDNFIIKVDGVVIDNYTMKSPIKVFKIY